MKTSEADEGEAAAADATVQRVAHNCAVVTALSSQLLTDEAAHQAGGRFLMVTGANARLLLLLAAVRACASGCGRHLTQPIPLTSALIITHSSERVLFLLEHPSHCTQ